MGQSSRWHDPVTNVEHSVKYKMKVTIKDEPREDG